VLEAVIVFFRSLFLKYDCNVREFSRMFCHFQIVSIVRWHVGGFPLIMVQNRQTQDLRKALRGEIGKLYHEVWGFHDDFNAIQNGSASNSEHGWEACAACVHHLRTTASSSHCHASQSLVGACHNQENIVQDRDAALALVHAKGDTKKRSYDTFFLKDWSYIHENIAHTNAATTDETAVMPGHTITC